MSHRSWSVLLALCLALLPARAGAQDVLGQARSAATRREGLAILERHLREAPRDVDARLLYGLMLSWEGRYDAARRELRQVLDQTPTYADARIGLMNVEWWSGNRSAAREQADLVLARDPGNPQARLVRQRLDAATRPWTVTVYSSHDRFNDGRNSWNEEYLSLSRQTPAGSIILRGNRADRFGSSDEQIEVEFYPTFRPGTYAFVGVGASPDHALYPKHRVAFDVYQNVGHGVELSVGYRRLQFADTTTIFVSTVSKYLGNWMLTGKVYHVPAEAGLDSTSGHAQIRRYFGSRGTSFIGGGYSHGLSREEIRGAGDLLTLDNHTFRTQLDLLLAERWRLKLDASTSRQERARGGELWQTSLGGGFSVEF